MARGADDCGGSPLLDLGLLAIPSFRRGVLVGTLFFFTTSFYVLFAIYEQEGKRCGPPTWRRSREL